MSHDVYGLLLLDLAVILVAARLGGLAFARLGQPPVIGEVLVGILLGPTLLGPLSEGLFPLSTRPLLGVLATIGVILFMFLVGLEVDRGRLRWQARAAGAVSLTGIAVPFALGVALGFVLRSSYPHGDLLPFVLFMGTAMSITAFPVLVRILQERQLDRHPLGVLVIAAAALDDLMAWIILALVISLATAEGPLELPLTVCSGPRGVLVRAGVPNSR